MPVLPPITTTVWPRSSGSRWRGKLATAVFMISPLYDGCLVRVPKPERNVCHVACVAVPICIGEPSQSCSRMDWA